MFNPEKPELEKNIIQEIIKQTETKVDFIILIESSYNFVNNLMKTKYELISIYIL